MHTEIRSHVYMQPVQFTEPHSCINWSANRKCLLHSVLVTVLL